MKNQMFLNICAVIIAVLLVFTGCPTDNGGGDSADRTVDVVIVGSGIAGNLAALGAKEGGAAKVLLIEKMDYYGGTSRLAGGGLSQLEAKTKKQEFLDNWKAHSLVDASFPFPNYDKLYSVAAEVQDTVDYLTAEGITFTVSDRAAPRLKYAQTDVGTTGKNGGAVLMEKLEQIVKSKGVEILMNCKAEQLTVEKGAVTGLTATYKGGSFKIKAKNVILAAGGFSQNPELVARWAGGVEGLKDVIPGTDSSATGEGILMALDAGAVVYNINNTPSTFTDISGLTFATAVNAVSGAAALRTSPNLNYQIIVDSQGRRFTSEEDKQPANVGYNTVIHDMVVHGRGPYYIIFDATNTNNITTGTNASVVLNDVLDAAAIAAPTEVIKSDSLANLATAINAPNLAQTVTDYNSAVADEYGKSAAFVKQLSAAGTCYAVKIYAQTLGSMGGVITDTQGRVLNAGGTPIPHLYAVGETSNRDFYGQSYVGGGSLGLYSTIGRRAGKTAAADK